MKGKTIDLTGEKYGKLIAIKKCGKNKSGNTLWLCKCECGKETKVCISNLRGGHTKSCGCYAIEQVRLKKAGLKHGKSHTRLYHIWQGMKARCTNIGSRDYSDYGGRGIRISKEWENSFEKFYSWAMSNGYKDNLTIDRIDVNGNYEPLNCRWVDVKTQNRNKTTTNYISLNGITKSIGEWHELLGIPVSTIVNRKNKGLPPELILKQGRFNTRKPDYESELERIKTQNEKAV